MGNEYKRGKIVPFAVLKARWLASTKDNVTIDDICTDERDREKFEKLGYIKLIEDAIEQGKVSKQIKDTAKLDPAYNFVSPFSKSVKPYVFSDKYHHALSSEMRRKYKYSKEHIDESELNRRINTLWYAHIANELIKPGARHLISAISSKYKFARSFTSRVGFLTNAAHIAFCKMHGLRKVDIEEHIDQFWEDLVHNAFLFAISRIDTYNPKVHDRIDFYAGYLFGIKIKRIVCDNATSDTKFATYVKTEFANEDISYLPENCLPQYSEYHEELIDIDRSDLVKDGFFKSLKMKYKKKASF